MTSTADYETFSTLPGTARLGRVRDLRRALRRHAARAVQARAAGDHAGAPVLGRHALRRTRVDARRRSDAAAPAGWPPGIAGDPRYAVRRGRAATRTTRPPAAPRSPIPNPYTGRFDSIGAFVAPAQLLLHAQVTYDVNKRFTLVGNFANIVNRCFGGTKVPFAVNHACGYGPTYGAGGGILPVGNVYNPGDRIQPFLATPYDPLFASSPFGMFLEARIKL